jgi:hypothetical protein
MASRLKDLRDSVLRHSAAGSPSPHGSESPKSLRKHSIERTEYLANAWQRQSEAAPLNGSSPRHRMSHSLVICRCVGSQRTVSTSPSIVDHWIPYYRPQPPIHTIPFQHNDSIYTPSGDLCPPPVSSPPTQERSKLYKFPQADFTRE